MTGTDMDFRTAFIQILGNEGGYTVDRGGPTNWGISQRAYPELSTAQIQALTQDQAAGYYFRDYWVPVGCESVPDLIKFELFDIAVNTSARGAPKNAIRLLQRAAGVMGAGVDGVLGPVTLLAVNSMNPWRLLHRLAAYRVLYYTGLRAELWTESGRGWMNRVALNALKV